MTKVSMIKPRFDLEDRTYEFSKAVAVFCRSLPSHELYTEYRQQLMRSASSVGANYIEANESLGRKDFLMCIKICRKEAKETIYWLRLLLVVSGTESENVVAQLIVEATELKKIFSSIAEKSK